MSTLRVVAVGIADPTNNALVVVSLKGKVILLDLVRIYVFSFETLCFNRSPSHVLVHRILFLNAVIFEPAFALRQWRHLVVFYAHCFRLPFIHLGEVSLRLQVCLAHCSNVCIVIVASFFDHLVFQLLLHICRLKFRFGRAIDPVLIVLQSRYLGCLTHVLLELRCGRCLAIGALVDLCKDGVCIGGLNHATSVVGLLREALSQLSNWSLLLRCVCVGDVDRADVPNIRIVETFCAVGFIIVLKCCDCSLLQGLLRDISRLLH